MIALPKLRLAGAVVAALATAASTARAELPDIPFVISKPAGNGPFPAVVMLHDCSGLGPRSSGAPWRWSSELTRWGFVTIWPDSFSTRGFPNGVCREAGQGRTTVGPGPRRNDAYAALAHLRTLAFVDGRRVAVMGGSHGGSTVLASIVATPSNMVRGEPGFAAAIAFYPACRNNFGDWRVERTGEGAERVFSTSGVFKPLAPTLILAGALDDWTPAEPCQRLVEAAKAAGHPIDIIVYPEAHHSFDSGAAVSFDPLRVNSNAAGGRGATVGGNREAWDKARIAVREFLQRTLGQPAP